MLNCKSYFTILLFLYTDLVSIRDFLQALKHLYPKYLNINVYNMNYILHKAESCFRIIIIKKWFTIIFMTISHTIPNFLKFLVILFFKNLI